MSQRLVDLIRRSERILVVTPFRTILIGVAAIFVLIAGTFTPIH